MAFMVIFSHAGPIAGFYGGEDLGVQISKEQSIGGVAVAGFFFFSGFLITRSRMGRATVWRYMWRRVLRIFPAFWAALLFTVGILAPIAYWHTYRNISGYLHPATESPLTYFVNNMWLNLGQRNIAGMGENLPYFILHGARDWNGSAWTLIYEFKAYILVAILGLFGALANRKVGGAFALVLIALNALQWMGAGQVANVNYLLRDPYMLMFLGPFAFGMLFTLYGDKIPMDSRLAWGAHLRPAVVCVGRLEHRRPVRLPVLPHVPGDSPAPAELGEARRPVLRHLHLRMADHGVRRLLPPAGSRLDRLPPDGRRDRAHPGLPVVAPH